MRRVERRGAVPALTLGSTVAMSRRDDFVGEVEPGARECAERARVRRVALSFERGCRRLEGDSSRTRAWSTRFRLPSSA